jgi:hypothetical protein
MAGQLIDAEPAPPLEADDADLEAHSFEGPSVAEREPRHEALELSRGVG